MNNILDYIEWRGDLTFAQDPFNEVDNLILSIICYADFEYIVNAMDNPVLISKVSEQFFSKYTAGEIEKKRGTFQDGAKVLKKAAESRRFCNTKLFGYVNEVSSEDNSQFAALSFALEDKTVYAAYRGTDASLEGWKENINMAYLYQTPGQKKAVRYLNEKHGNADYKLRIGGHSKGGNFAVFGASFCDYKIQDRIISVYNNDGPGFRSDVTSYSGYQRVLPKVISILPNESIVGMILDNDAKYVVIRSNKTGIWQHDATTWLVSKNNFLKCDELSNKSKIIDDTITKWLDGLNDDDRKQFIDALFDLLYLLQKEDMSSIDDLLKMIHEDKGKIKANKKNLSKVQLKIIKDTKFKLIWSAISSVTPGVFDEIKDSFLQVFGDMKKLFGEDDMNNKKNDDNDNISKMDIKDPDLRFLYEID